MTVLTVDKHCTICVSLVAFYFFSSQQKNLKEKKKKRKKKKKKYFAYTNHSLLKTKRASLNHGFIHVTLIRNTMVVMRYCKYKVIQIKWYDWYQQIPINYFCMSKYNWVHWDFFPKEKTQGISSFFLASWIVTLSCLEGERWEGGGGCSETKGRWLLSCYQLKQHSLVLHWTSTTILFPGFLVVGIASIIYSFIYYWINHFWCLSFFS